MSDLHRVFGPVVGQLPYVLRLLAENVARCMAHPHRDAALAAFAAWPNNRTSDVEIEFTPNRLLMHDTTSVPALVDLAAMRDALVADGRDPGLLAPVLPVEVSVDHSLSVQAYASAAARRDNERLELTRHAERFTFLKWAAGAMPQVRVNPPGTGIMHTLNLEQLATVTDAHDGMLRPDVMLGTDSHTPMVNALGVLGWGIGGLEAELAMLGVPTTLRIPDVVGVRLVGRLGEGVTATDLALTNVDPHYTRTLELDLTAVTRTVAGPTRPQDPMPLADVPAALPSHPESSRGELPALPVAIAAITSCTNTTDPAQLIAAGLLARKARQTG